MDNDAKIIKAEMILSVSKILFGIEVFLLAIGGFALIIASFLIAKENINALDWRFLVGGLASFVAIFFCWAGKQLMDGFALIVYKSAVDLHDRGVLTSLDDFPGTK